MHWRDVYSKGIVFIKKNFLYIVAAYVVTVWTLLRFATHPSIYDLVTQQLVARQWIQGNFNPITLGTTHYFLKTIFLYVPLSVIPGSERLKLITLTIFVNLITFLLITHLIKKILKEFKVPHTAVPQAIIWLSVIAGSVFWISFTNSRNLEVAAGLYLIASLITYRGNPWALKRIVLLTIFAGFLFFSDTLQVFMTAVPLLVFMYIARRRHFYHSVSVVLGGYIVSKVLFFVVATVFNITFSGNGATFGTVDIIGAIKSTVVLFAGSTDAGLFRVGVNILFTGWIGALFIYGFLQKKLPRDVSYFVAIFFVCNELVYIFSGQAHQSHTSRYLIMLAPIFLVAFAASFRLVPRKVMLGMYSVVIILNAGALTTRLYDVERAQISIDQHLISSAEYINSHKNSYAYGSMDTALSLSYYSRSPNTQIAALACVMPNLVKARSVPVFKNVAPSTMIVPIILDTTNIANSPQVCDEAAIKTQLGEPSSTSQTSDGSTVLYYPAGKINALGF